MINKIIRGTQKIAGISGITTVVFLLAFTGSSLFADSSRDNKQKQKTKTRACHIKCPPVRNVKDIRRHAACVAKRAKVCR